jgi:fibronectin-binding autotransporter adhesin
VGLGNSINVTASSTLQYDNANAYACVLRGPLSGTIGQTLTINHSAVGAEDRLRLYANFTNDANVVLNDSSVWLAPYASGGDQVFNGVISGPGNIVNRAGGSILYLNGANTFSGLCRLTTGTLGLGVDSTPTSGTVVTSPLGTGPLTLQNEGTSVGGNGAVLAAGGARVVANPIVYYRTNEFTFIISGVNDLTLSGNMDLHGQSDGLGGVNRAIQVDNTGRSTLSGVISDGSLTCGIVKTGSGTLQLNGANTYTGPTIVSNGILAGTGSIVSPVTVADSGTIGAGTASIGTFTVNNNLTLNGNGFFKLDKSLSPGQSNDMVSVSGVLTNTSTGTITVTNIGVPALVVGDSFKLFSGAVSNGTALIVTGGGMNWTNKLAIDGSIQALSVVSTTASYPTNITATVSGNNLQITWPATHLGWMVEAQTNTLSVGLSTNWVTISNTATQLGYTITMDPSKGSVFYRLRHP